VQYDAGRRATWPILDSGGDVIALCDLGGANNSARVLTRIVYDAYGRVIGRSDPATPATGPPELRVGHKGLFFDRLDWGIVDPLTLAETPRLEPGATLLGYNRNRTLHVGWGRFLQRDPNATGLPVQAGLGFHGDGFDASVQGFDLAAHYGDGANVYEYVGSNPLGASDPTGLMEFSMAGQLATMAINSWESSSGTLESARMGVQTGFSLVGMIDAYAAMQIADVEWASDMSLPDDWNSRSGFGGPAEDVFSSANGPAMASEWQDWDGDKKRYHNRGPKGGYNTWHQHNTKAWAEYFATKFGSRNDVRFNQKATSVLGVSRGNVRPDVLAFDPKTGTYHAVEIGNSRQLNKEQASARRRSIAHALGVDVSDVRLTVQNRGQPIRTHGSGPALRGPRGRWR
jgi:hypothetical protein